MKKLLSGFFILICILGCAFLYGCGGKYANLTFSVAVSYDEAIKTQELTNNTTRVTLKNGGVFDDHKNGSYTFYIVQGSQTSATLSASYTNTPSDFNLGVSYNLSNEIVKVSDNLSYNFNDKNVKTELTAFSKGQTILTFLSAEGNKQDRITINVVEVASGISFISKPLALIRNNNSTLTLDPNNVIELTPKTSTVTNISYTFGYLNTDGNFVSFEDRLANYGLTYNARTYVLSVYDQTKLVGMEDFYIKATYSSPLGDNLEAVTKVKLVNEVSNFEIYKGNKKEDINDLTKLTFDQTQELILNIAELNYIDLILKVKSNKEEVSFAFPKSSSLPVNITLVDECYIDRNDYTVNNYATADYYLAFVKINATNYYKDLLQTNFTCDYKKYKVDNYPLNFALNFKINNLVRNFAINGAVLDSFDISSVDSTLLASYLDQNAHSKAIYDSEVYKNSVDVSGTPYRFDVGNTTEISRENSKFKLRLYAIIEGELKDVTSTAGTYFVNMEGLDGYTFDRNTTLSFLPNRTYFDNSENYDIKTFFLVATAVRPEDYVSLQAKATIRLRVVKGITNFDSYDYQTKKYQIDEATGEYLLDDKGQKIPQEINKQGLLFENKIGAEKINFDLTSGFDATVKLYCQPFDASIKNLSILPNSNIVEVSTINASEEVEIEGIKYLAITFKITPKQTGEGYIEISNTNMRDIYKIYVNVYRPISDFRVVLNSFSFLSGVGDHTLLSEIDKTNADKQSVAKVVSKVGSSIMLNLSTLPVDASKFTYEYSLYNGETKIGATLLVDYDGKAFKIDNDEKIQVDYLSIENGDFSLSCAKNKTYVTYSFPNNNSDGAIYTLKIKLINIDGSIIEKTVDLSCYVPIGNIKLTPTQANIYNPNTLSYFTKLDPTNPSVFGVKIEESAPRDMSYPVTFNFKDKGNGKIEIRFKDKFDHFTSVKNGNNYSLTPSDTNSTLEFINLDANNYYWFKLKDTANFGTTDAQLYFKVIVEEFSNPVSREFNLTVRNAEKVSSLITSANEQLYFKLGITTNINVSLDVLKDTAYNKNLQIKVFDILDDNSYTNRMIKDPNNTSVLLTNPEATESYLDKLTLTKQNFSSSFNLEILPKSAGRSVIIIMPEDKVITESDFEKFNSTKVSDIISLWKYCMVFYVDIADGVKVPYQIANYSELKEISKDTTSISKRYVLTRDIYSDNKNYTPIANYYQVESVTAQNLNSGIYYELKNGEYVKSTTYNSKTKYYICGFNGELSGKYTYFNIKTEISVDNFYKINNLVYEGQEDKDFFGLIEILGENGKLLDLDVRYSSYRPVLKKEFVFGGLTAINFGLIKNSRTTLDGFVVNLGYKDSASKIIAFKTIIGGLAGKNYGEIVNNNALAVGVSGNVKVIALSKDITTFIGGFAGENYGTITGSFAIFDDPTYTFNDAGFDSSLNIKADIDISLSANTNIINSAIGGIVGINHNFAQLKNLSVQGTIDATNFNKVGGLVGYAKYSGASLQEQPDDFYNLANSYSIAKVKGYQYVGGAIGYAEGQSSSLVKLYYVSAENYAVSSNRTFVEGTSDVGGLIGYCEYAKIQYSYVVSYFDSIDTNLPNTQIAYDIVSKSSAGGLISKAFNTTIENCAGVVNVNADQSDIFIQTVSTVTISNVFAIGNVRTLFATTQSKLKILTSTSGSYNYCYVRKIVTGDNTVYVDVWDNKGNATLENIKGVVLPAGWTKDTRNIADNKKANGGLPYLTITFKGNVEPLFATSPIVVTADVKDSDYTNFIKNTALDNLSAEQTADNKSLILFLNKDENGQYIANDIAKLNIINLNIFALLRVDPQTYKSLRLNIETSNKDVISIANDGLLKIVGEGRVTITISSKLNKDFNTKLYIVVKYGVSDINLYADPSNNVNLKTYDQTIKVFKTRSEELYLQTDYIRNLEHETDAYLKSCENDVGVRFIVNVADMVKYVNGNNVYLIDGKNSTDYLNEVFKFNNQSWLKDTSNNFYFVDVPSGQRPVINPVNAMNSDFDYLTISYVPYIKTIFRNTESIVLFDTEAFTGNFNLKINNGATKISLNNNLDIKRLEISQIEHQTFNVTIETDSESDDIISNVGGNTSAFSNTLEMYKSDIKYEYEQKEVNGKTVRKLKRITRTFTISYKDKVNAVEEDIYYAFYFYALSDATKRIDLTFVVVGQYILNDINGVVYTDVEATSCDFPNNPNKSNLIYNGTVGALVIDVYPYFSNYNKLRVHYETNSQFPMLITQLYYNINGTGAVLSDYADSGSISDGNQYLFVSKGTGQSTLLFNNSDDDKTGKYSYSKTYFFGMLVGSDVPNNTEYVIYIDFLTRDGIIIHTYTHRIRTIAQPSVTFTFNDKLKGSDNAYYLPINTDNEISLNRINFNGEVEWDITSTEYFLTQREKDALIPYKKSENVYVLRMFKYLQSGAVDNVFSTDVIGKSFVLTATITDENQRTYKFKQTIIVSLFTITDINVQMTQNGYMSVPMSTTNPLQVSIDVAYDKALTASTDNWYKEWFNLYGKTKEESNLLYSYLIACGYAIEEYFSDYFIQLSNSIAKATYNYKDDITNKMSGVWFYNSKDDTAGFLQVNKEYNDTTFGVEMYNGYFAVYGYQIDRNSNMALKVNLSYSNNDELNPLTKANGIPNVHNYSAALNSTYKSIFKFEKKFILNFVYKSDLINAIPVSTAEEFLSMKEGSDYRLINDIELTNYTPLSTAIKTFDGNNYKIYITGFNVETNKDSKEAMSFGLFKEISKNTMLYNVNVYYVNRVYKVNGLLNPSLNALNVILPEVNEILFGGITATNNGVLTNCHVMGKLNLTLNIDKTPAINGGLVGRNNATGYITNSSVIDFDFSSYGFMGGFVGENNGKIVASFFDKSSLNNLSDKGTGGFVYSNLSKIYECFSQGYRNVDDNDIRNKGRGISSNGSVGGFVYSNSGEISDTYSNIFIKSSAYSGGFVHETLTENSKISRSYAISAKEQSDNNRVSYPFASPDANNVSKITINGTLNDCFFLAGTGDYSSPIWASTLATKQAKGLNFAQFSMQTYFINYDLSLIDSEGTYANGEDKFKYVDGYTWVIIDGKPVLVSTLVKTISQRNYVGKTKNYSRSLNYYNEQFYNGLVPVEANLGIDKVRINYYDNRKGLEVSNLTIDDLIFYTIQDNTNLTLTYYFSKDKALNNDYKDAITLTFAIEVDASNKITKKELLTAEYGLTQKVVLDARTQAGKVYVEDNNFRANDTVEIEFNDKGIISSLTYKELESASYHYGSNALNISEVVGSRTNPQIIYDFESFVFYLNSNTGGKFYRIIKDIDFDYQFSTTSYSNFQGSLQGNYMEIQNLAISYLSDYNSGITEKQRAFGLFASVSTIEPTIHEVFNTIISNLAVNVVEVTSNTHEFVGALAGQILANNGSSANRKLILNNISINGVTGKKSLVQGKNAVGGLAGIIQGDVIIKDISASVNVNASKELLSGNVGAILYTNAENVSNIAYAGGIAGIFDCNTVIDPSTQKNFNATNLNVGGNIYALGSVVGSVFGLVGQNTVVNYANVVVQTDNTRNFIKAICYAGGLVGENRGTIISSSVSYGSGEDFSQVGVAMSMFARTNFFYNGLDSDTTIAIGGLVGINNGGTISNSYASINARNTNATIAGGAVGRMIAGKLENVMAYGSVVSRSIVGGLIGTANDTSIMLSAGYNEDAIVVPSEGDGTQTIIKNSLALNNWLYSDYERYKQLFSRNNPVAGFIGLISNLSINADFIKFEGSNYYTNTLYSSNMQSKPDDNIPQRYLKPAYTSNTLDLTTNLGASVKNVLADSLGNQAVFPYSIREAYYEQSDVGINYTITDHTNSYSTSKPNEGRNPYVERFYRITTTTGSNIPENILQLYTLIDFNPDSDFTKKWKKINSNITWTSDGFETYENYIEHFGTVYRYDTNTKNYVELTYKPSDDDFARYKASGLYMIISPKLEKFKRTKTYSILNSNDIVVDATTDLEAKKYDDRTFTKFESLKNIDQICLNGISIRNLGSVISGGSEAEGFYTAEYNNVNWSLPNNIRIVYLSLKAQTKEITTTNILGVSSKETYWEVYETTLIYEYDTSKEYIFIGQKSKGITETIYSLHVSSKNVIFRSFLGNGYWDTTTEVKNMFLLESDFANRTVSDKYLKNLEYADTYLWNSFASESWGSNYEDGTEQTFEIATPQELATFSNLVNSGKTFENKTINLTSNIDLSGKYWVPIGGEFNVIVGEGEDATTQLVTRPFMGTFNGNNHTIRYATVNEISNKNLNYYGGLFGITQNATITDLNIHGGDILGKISGGVVGLALDNLTLTNITNNNNVKGESFAGGLVGKIVKVQEAESTITLQNLNNYGYISHENAITENSIAFGGIVGNIIGNYTLSTINNLKNFGDVRAVNTRTVYANNETKKLMEVNIGGVIGKLESDIILNNLSNKGNVNVTSNAHDLKVGGVVGNMTNVVLLKNLKNYGKVVVNYTNVYNEVLGNLEYSSCFVGGVIGDSSSAIETSGNEGIVELGINTTSNTFLSIGGLCGVTSANVDKCYNSNNVEATAISRKTTLSVGGLVGAVKIATIEKSGDTVGQQLSITNCHNSGDIQTSSSSMVYAGGIVGSSFVLDLNGKHETETKIVSRQFYFNHVKKEKEDEATHKVTEVIVEVVDNNSKLIVGTSLNIGFVNIISYNKLYNGLGAIAGFANFNMTFNNNFYLRDSAYSSNITCLAFCDYDEKQGFVTKDIRKTESGAITDTNTAKLTSSLKDITTYVGWSIGQSDSVWEQFHDTWFPSLKKNQSSAIWSDKQEEITQEKGAYVVRNAEQLAYLSSKINSGEIDSQKMTIRLGNFINLSNRYWVPIGTSLYPFKGTFDGNGYIIKNLTIDGTYTQNKVYGGLFGFVENATITNLGIEAPIVQNVDYASALAYNVKNCIISKVYTDGAKGLNPTSQGSLDTIILGKIGAGGLICEAIDCLPADKNQNLGGIYYCYNNVPVRVTNNTAEYVGGLVGNMVNTLISNCYNNVNGSVQSSTLLVEGNRSSCPIVGKYDGQIELINVFNLAEQLKDPSNTYTCSPSLYGIISGEIAPKEQPPYFANLIGEKKGDIWSQENEYTLNADVNANSYPSLRGLGGNWKNTESEAPATYVYANTNQNIETAILEKVKTLGYVEKDTDGVTDLVSTNVCLYTNNVNEISRKTYYFITSEEELSWVSSNVNAGKLPTLNCEFILLEDLDLGGKYWTPIGASSIYPFQGIFNFNGHKIKGLTIDTSIYVYGGLFGYTNGAKIVDGYLEDAFVKVMSDNSQTEIYVGALIGRASNTLIKNIRIETTLSATSNSGTFVGGVVGWYASAPENGISNVKVSKAVSTRNGVNIKKYIDISSFENEVIEIKDNNQKINKDESHMISIGAFSTGGHVFVGGIVGYISGYKTETGASKNILENASNENDIAGVTTSRYSRTFAGGIVGYSLEEVRMNVVKNNGYIKTFTGQYDFVGGIAGYMSKSSVKNAMFNGYLEPSQNTKNDRIISRVGGIVGYMQAGGTLKYCLNIGTTNLVLGDARVTSHVGGIVGASYDRAFTDDANLIFTTEQTGFDNLIGFNDNLEKLLEKYKGDATNDSYIKEKEAYLNVIKSKFSTTPSNTSSFAETSQFGEYVWASTDVNTSKISIKGGNGLRATIGETSVGDLMEGATVNNLDLSVEVNYNNRNDDDRIIISLRDINGNYMCISKTIAQLKAIDKVVTDKGINIGKLLEITDASITNSVVMSLSLIKAPTEPV